MTDTQTKIPTTNPVPPSSRHLLWSPHGHQLTIRGEETIITTTTVETVETVREVDTGMIIVAGTMISTEEVSMITEGIKVKGEGIKDREVGVSITIRDMIIRAGVIIIIMEDIRTIHIIHIQEIIGTSGTVEEADIETGARTIGEDGCHQSCSYFT